MSATSIYQPLIQAEISETVLTVDATPFCRHEGVNGEIAVVIFSCRDANGKVFWAVAEILGLSTCVVSSFRHEDKRNALKEAEEWCKSAMLKSDMLSQPRIKVEPASEDNDSDFVKEIRRRKEQADKERE